MPSAPAAPGKLCLTLNSTQVNRSVARIQRAGLLHPAPLGAARPTEVTMLFLRPRPIRRVNHT